MNAQFLTESFSQRDLFGGAAPGIDDGFHGLETVALGDGAWVAWCPGWLGGHEAVYDALSASMQWHSEQRAMYDRLVDVPRLTASIPDDGAGHPIVEAARRALGQRFDTVFESVRLAWYRDGRDSVAPHGDRVGREVEETTIAIVSLGAPRRFHLKPAAGGPAKVYQLCGGDLLVMGGTCQRTWHHAIPKVKNAGSRISIQFRAAHVE